MPVHGTLDPNRTLSQHQLWVQAEAYIRRKYDLVVDRDEGHDARNPEDDGPVEIKSCCKTYQNDHPGKFKIWTNQLRDIRTNDGYFAFLVYIDDPFKRVLATNMLSYFDLPSDRTTHWVNHPTMGYRSLTVIPWPDVIPFRNVTFYRRRGIMDFYPENEIEEIYLPAPFDPDCYVEKR